MPDELRWLVDFDRAVADGLGFRVPLDDATRGGLDRLVVLGLRLATDASATAAGLETLLAHHLHGGSGLALVPQGTPTNNTAGAPSGVSRGDDADATFLAPFAAPAAFDPAADWLARRDGQWLADWLGIDPAALEQVPGAHGSDQLEARAMQTALWPATLGYATQTLLQPLLDDRTRLDLRAFATRFVSGRGPVPAVRVGRQPYGILPATAYSRLRLGGKEAPDLLDALARRLAVARADWAGLAQGAARVRASDAPLQTLLDVLGLQATSAEYGQRYAESLADLYNRANLGGFGERMLASWQAGGEDAAALALLARLGAPAGVEPELLRLFFFRAAQGLHGPLIEDRPLSETAALAPATPDGRDYIAWLADAARSSLETVRREQGFATTPPDALLYLLLRHAVLLGYWDGRAASRGRRRCPRHGRGRGGAGRARVRARRRGAGREREQVRAALPEGCADHRERRPARRRLPADRARLARRDAAAGRAARRARRAAGRPDGPARAPARRARGPLLVPARRVARGARARASRDAARDREAGAAVRAARRRVRLARGGTAEGRSGQSRSSSTPPRRRSSRRRALHPSYATRRTAATCTRPR